MSKSAKALADEHARIMRDLERQLEDKKRRDAAPLVDKSVFEILDEMLTRF